MAAIAKRQAGDNRLSADNCALLFIDHQTGLLQLVKDFGVDEFKNSVLALIDIGKFFKLPVVLTSSFEVGPNGPLVPELKEAFPEAPTIPRPGQINAWDNEDFVHAVRATGRNKVIAEMWLQLIMAGIVTDVCIAFPALAALAEGFEVYIVVDCSGTFNQAVRDATLMRCVAAGAVPINWFSLACELHKDWRNDMDGLATLLGNHLPAYKNLMGSYSAAEAAAKK